MFGTAGLATAGIAVCVGGHPRLLFGRVSNLLSDGDGLRMGLDWRGAGSLKPCWKHFNVMKKGSNLVDGRPGFVDATCFDVSRFRAWTARQVHDAADAVLAAAARAATGEITQASFEELVKGIGINPNRHGLLHSVSLRLRCSPLMAVVLRIAFGRVPAVMARR